MLKERVDELEQIVNELDGRCLMHDMIIAHLLGSVGSTTGNAYDFVNKLLGSVAADIRDNGVRAVGTPDAQRFVYAIKTLELFAQSMQGSLKERSPNGMN
ncbi:hypothetical protein [Rhizobium sp. RCAM05973]|uniref:hypothetical protein n=1 Tax=Rhizobium sp. RCAM05973 TaxID=2994066 RepID=UPI0022EBE59E|nr:hypothetical protein [Rhizobium sp. RCAM05973]